MPIIAFIFYIWLKKGPLSTLGFFIMVIGATGCKAMPRLTLHPSDTDGCQATGVEWLIALPNFLKFILTKCNKFQNREDKIWDLWDKSWVWMISESVNVPEREGRIFLVCVNLTRRWSRLLMYISTRQQHVHNIQRDKFGDKWGQILGTQPETWLHHRPDTPGQGHVWKLEPGWKKTKANFSWFKILL